MFTPPPEKELVVTARLSGSDYKFRIDLAALAAAELFYHANGHPEFKLVSAMTSMARREDSLLQVVACSLLTFHPEVAFEEMRDLLRLSDGYFSNYYIMSVIHDGWEASTTLDMKDAMNNLSFDLEELANASDFFNREGYDVKLRVALTNMNLAGVRSIFPFALHRYRPELTFADAQNLLSMRAVGEVLTGVGGLFKLLPRTSDRCFCIDCLKGRAGAQKRTPDPPVASATSVDSMRSEINRDFLPWLTMAQDRQKLPVRDGHQPASAHRQRQYAFGTCGAARA